MIDVLNLHAYIYIYTNNHPSMAALQKENVTIKNTSNGM